MLRHLHSALGRAAARVSAARARRRCVPRHFDARWYLQRYADVAAAGIDPLYHYQRYGAAEGRLPAFMVAPLRERDLRWGLAATPDGGLAALARGAVPDQSAADRVWAALALARAAARAGDWPGAAGWLDPLDARDDLVAGFCQPDHSLLAVEVWARTGAFTRAEAQLALARGAFGRTFDLGLAEANIAALAEGPGARWHAAVRRAWGGAGLGAIEAPPGPGLPFDRLRAAPGRTRTGGPLVSVIVPVRNAEATLATALRSLTAQDWRALEILVVDNGSTDGTARVAAAAARDDPRIRVLDGAAAPGAYGARNLGMAEARGAYLTVLDGDDWAHPARIALQVAALEAAPGAAAALAAWVRTTPDLVFARWWGEAGLVHDDISSLMLRAEARARLGFWDEIRAGADSEYVARLQAALGPDALVRVRPGAALGLGRVHAGSLTQEAGSHVHSYMHGPRRQYEAAAARWHRAGADLALPRGPDRRAFPVPPALALEGAATGGTEAHPVAAAPLFDADWCLRTYADLRTMPGHARIDPALDYAAGGEAAGRSPGPGFAPSAYTLAYGLDPGTSALAHYTSGGRAAGADPLPSFAGALEAGRQPVLFAGHQAGARIFGAERALLDALDSAAEAGQSPHVVLPHILDPGYLEALRARACAVHVIPYGWRFGDVLPPARTVDLLAGLIARTGARAVHQNTAVLAAPLAAARAAGVPGVVHVHERPADDPELCQGLGLTAAELRQRLLAEADRFVVLDAAMADWLGAPADVVPGRIDRALFDLPAPAPDAGPLRVGLVGSLVAKKGLAAFAALARAAGQDEDLRFVLVGPETPDLRALGPLPPNLSHAGYAPDPAAAIAPLDVVMSLSDFAESFGRTVLEAMAAGRPVICHDRGAPPDLVGRDGAAGRVVPVGDAGAALGALRALAADPAARAAMGAAARARARAHQDAARAAARAAFALHKL